jgi:hypothetical protein
MKSPMSPAISNPSPASPLAIHPGPQVRAPGEFPPLTGFESAGTPANEPALTGVWVLTGVAVAVDVGCKVLVAVAVAVAVEVAVGGSEVLVGGIAFFASWVS